MMCCVQVTSISREEVLRQEAYMLFYLRNNTRTAASVRTSLYYFTLSLSDISTTHVHSFVIVNYDSYKFIEILITRVYE